MERSRRRYKSLSGYKPTLEEFSLEGYVIHSVKNQRNKQEGNRFNQIYMFKKSQLYMKQNIQHHSLQNNLHIKDPSELNLYHSSTPYQPTKERSTQFKPYTNKKEILNSKIRLLERESQIDNVSFSKSFCNDNFTPMAKTPSNKKRQSFILNKKPQFTPSSSDQRNNSFLYTLVATKLENVLQKRVPTPIVKNRMQIKRQMLQLSSRPDSDIQGWIVLDPQ